MSIPAKKRMEILQASAGGPRDSRGFIIITTEPAQSPGVDHHDSLVFESVEELAKYVSKFFAGNEASLRG